MKEEIRIETALEQIHKDYDNRDLLMEGVPEVDQFGTPKRLVLEQMMKNQMKALEGTLALPQGAIEATINTSTAVPTLTGNILPILRRFYPDEIAFDLVQVSPMTAPTGLAIWMNERYGTTEGGGDPDAITAKDRLDLKFSKTYSDEASEGDNAVDVYIDTSQAALKTKTKKVRTSATIQTFQDFEATMQVRYEAAATLTMANLLRKEIGGVIISDLYNNAVANVNWSASGSLISSFVDMAEWRKTIMDAVVDAGNTIYSSAFRLPNVLVASPTFWARFRKPILTDFTVNPLLTSQPQAITGRYYAGMTGDGLRCYVDPITLPTNTAMLLYRGSEFNDAAGIYAPYIPFWATPPQYDTTTGNYSRLVMSRYGVVNESNASGETWVNGSIVLNKNLVVTITVTGS